MQSGNLADFGRMVGHPPRVTPIRNAENARGVPDSAAKGGRRREAEEVRRSKRENEDPT